MAGKPQYTVEIRGVLYPTAKAAADAFGLKVHSIYHALSVGKIDRVGMGRTQTSVRVGLTTYASLKEASQKLGIPYDRMKYYAKKKRRELTKRGVKFDKDTTLDMEI